MPEFEGSGDAQQEQQQQQQHIQQQADLLQQEQLGSSYSTRAGDGTASAATAAAAAGSTALDELDPGAGFRCSEGISDAEHHAAAAAAAESQPGAGSVGSSSEDGEQQQQQLPDDFDYSGEVPEHDHSQKRQELIIYAIPLTRGKVRRPKQLAGQSSRLACSDMGALGAGTRTCGVAAFVVVTLEPDACATPQAHSCVVVLAMCALVLL
jgi:hypothetical protein